MTATPTPKRTRKPRLTDDDYKRISVCIEVAINDAIREADQGDRSATVSAAIDAYALALADLKARVEAQIDPVAT